MKDFVSCMEYKSIKQIDISSQHVDSLFIRTFSTSNNKKKGN